MRWGVSSTTWFEGNSGTHVSISREGDNKSAVVKIDTDGELCRTVVLSAAEFAALQNIMRIIDGSEPYA